MGARGLAFGQPLGHHLLHLAFAGLFLTLFHQAQPQQDRAHDPHKDHKARPAIAPLERGGQMDKQQRHNQSRHQGRADRIKRKGPFFARGRLGHELGNLLVRAKHIVIGALTQQRLIEIGRHPFIPVPLHQRERPDQEGQQGKALNDNRDIGDHRLALAGDRPNDRGRGKQEQLDLETGRIDRKLALFFKLLNATQINGKARDHEQQERQTRVMDFRAMAMRHGRHHKAPEKVHRQQRDQHKPDARHGLESRRDAQTEFGHPVEHDQGRKDHQRIEQPLHMTIPAEQIVQRLEHPRRIKQTDHARGGFVLIPATVAREFHLAVGNARIGQARGLFGGGLIRFRRRLGLIAVGGSRAGKGVGLGGLFCAVRLGLIFDGLGRGGLRFSLGFGLGFGAFLGGLGGGGGRFHLTQARTATETTTAEHHALKLIQIAVATGVILIHQIIVQRGIKGRHRVITLPCVRLRRRGVLWNCGDRFIGFGRIGRRRAWGRLGDLGLGGYRLGRCGFDRLGGRRTGARGLLDLGLIHGLHEIRAHHLARKAFYRGGTHRASEFRAKDRGNLLRGFTAVELVQQKAVLRADPQQPPCFPMLEKAPACVFLFTRRPRDSHLGVQTIGSRLGRAGFGCGIALLHQIHSLFRPTGPIRFDRIILIFSQ